PDFTSLRHHLRTSAKRMRDDRGYDLQCDQREQSAAHVHISARFLSKVLWTSLESVAEGIYRRVCPLYTVDHRDHFHVAGSAIPFDSRGFRFLLSAAHVCVRENGAPRPLFTMGAER